jgi:hypothetical protein
MNVVMLFSPLLWPVFCHLLPERGPKANCLPPTNYGEVFAATPQNPLDLSEYNFFRDGLND